MKFKEFLESKSISMEKYEAMTAKETSALEIEFKEATNKALKEEFQSMIDEAKKGNITPDALETQLEKFKKELDNSDELKTLKEAVEKNENLLKEAREIAKKQGQTITQMKDGGLINPDFSVNKNVVREIVEKHLKESRALENESTNEHGLKVQEVKVLNNHSMGTKTTSQVADVRNVSKKYIAQKAGEPMYVGGSSTGSVSGQAQNRTSIGSIGIPLTANEHALDIFMVTNITGSLMNLLVYENLEANGEIVAEGVAPSADSRIELNDKDFKVFDFSATATISKNLLRDKGEVVDELVNQLADNIKTVLDNKLFNSGGDNTVTPWGVFNTNHSCETFNPLLFTGSSKKANVISVIGKAKLQARLNDWGADSTLLNPIQSDEIEDLKDADENSIRDNRLAVNNLGEVIGVKGMNKYQTNKVPQNSILVYDSTKQCIGLRQDIETEFGHMEGDFKKRRVSFVMDMRGAYGQKAKKSSIYVDSVSEAIAILKEDATASLNRVKAYATGSDASPLTIATLKNAGATSLVDANLSTYQTAVAGESSIADLSALQALIDANN